MGVSHNYRAICCKMGYRTDVSGTNKSTKGGITPFGGAANLPEKVSRDTAYCSDSIALSRDMGPLSAGIYWQLEGGKTAHKQGVLLMCCPCDVGSNPTRDAKVFRNKMNEHFLDNLLSAKWPYTVTMWIFRPDFWAEFWKVNFGRWISRRWIFQGGSLLEKTESKNSTQEFGSKIRASKICFPEFGPKFGFRRRKIPCADFCPWPFGRYFGGGIMRQFSGRFKEGVSKQRVTIFVWRPGWQYDVAATASADNVLLQAILAHNLVVLQQGGDVCLIWVPTKVLRSEGSCNFLWGPELAMHWLRVDQQLTNSLGKILRGLFRTGIQLSGERAKSGMLNLNQGLSKGCQSWTETRSVLELPTPSLPTPFGGSGLIWVTVWLPVRPCGETMYWQATANTPLPLPPFKPARKPVGNRCKRMKHGWAKMWKKNKSTWSSVGQKYLKNTIRDDTLTYIIPKR